MPGSPKWTSPDLPRDHIAEGLCGLPYRNRCIYYRSYHDRIVVLRVKHGAEDIKSQDFEL
ncbi:MULTISPECIES: type II toxin-antitoxin system RelE/ParE family toxin [Rhizobium]|uniref:type II toxin-antitoxin system RelE/ParE family toxin n=1 Tax=Rhizobium TaxID=379 RepID=UPI001FD305D2|nr:MULTISPECIES: type II toxin-antitoxin system RelE/ParE family toxin [Rhizobium]